MDRHEPVRIEALKIEALEDRRAPAGLPAAEAFCAGGAWHDPHTWGIRFIQDPCNTIDHPFPF